MDTYDLQETGEMLQNYIQLKRHELLILSWLTFKIFVKRKVRVPTHQIHNQYLGFELNKKDIYRIPPNSPLIDEHNQYSLQPFQSNSQSINNYVNIRLHVDRNTPKSQNQNSKIPNYYPTHQPHHHTERQESVKQRKIPFIVQEQYLLNCSDNDQFEDMVLDRLSKLEESISQIIEQKKIQEQNSGNIDYSNNSTPLFNNLHLNFKDPSSEEESFPQIYPSQINEDRNHRFAYYLQSSSLVKDSIQENSFEQEQDISDWKYIPIGKTKEPTENITKLKNILQNNHVTNQEYIFINDVDDFNSNQIPTYKGHNRNKSHNRPQQYTDRPYANGAQKYALNPDNYSDDQIDNNKRQKSASFRLNRIQMELQSTDQVEINDQFVSSNQKNGHDFNTHHFNLDIASETSEEHKEQIILSQRYIPIYSNSRADPSNELQRQIRESGQLN